jgi:hypothetical protein
MLPLILLAILRFFRPVFLTAPLAAFCSFLPEKIKTVSNAVSEKAEKFVKGKMNLVTPSGIEPESQV